MSQPHKVQSPPPSLAPEAQARWRVVAPLLGRRRFDPDLLATYCQVWVRWRQAEDTLAKTSQLVKSPRGGVAPSPLIAIAHQAAAQVRSLEERIGINTDAIEQTGPSDPDALLTRRALAASLGVHMMTVTKWERDGLPIAKRGRKGKPSLYREAEARAWLKAREEASQQPSGVLDVAQERARKERWQGLLAEQQYLMRGRELLPRVEVEKTWGTEVAAVRALILASYMTKADRVFRAATLEGLPGVERTLKEIAHEVLRELADPERPMDAKHNRRRKASRRLTKGRSGHAG